MAGRFEKAVQSFLNPDGSIRRTVDPSERNTVKHDKWDRAEFNEVISNIEALGLAQDDLLNITDTAPPAIMDVFWEFLKVEPKIKSPEEITPSHVINHAVLEELIELPDIGKIRFDSVLDTVASAFGVIDMEPELEIIFDKLKDLQEQAQQLEDSLIALSNGQALGGGDSGGNGSGEGGNIDDKKELAKRAQELLDRAKGMDQELKDNKFDMQQALRRGIEDASENAALNQKMSDAWGLDAGGLKNLPAKERIELSLKMRTDKFKLMAQLFGPMLKMAIAEQERKVHRVPHEVMDVELGSDISRVLPSEMLTFFDDDLDILWYKNFIESRLLQYAMDGEESVGRGSIILCEDGSGSMGGRREIWAKAVSLALLYIAGKQKRDFFGIHFGGVGEHRDFDFNHKTNKVTISYGNDVQVMDRLHGTVEWAETFFNGGTDFYTPLSIAKERLMDEFDRNGKVTGDIVFITDGECYLTEEFIAEIQEAKRVTGFKVWAVLIGFEQSCLSTFADRIIFLDEINEKIGGEDMRGVFGGV